MTCKHEMLSFGSGDYYLFCDQCGDRWVKHREGRREYGFGVDGREIGADPTACIEGFSDRRARRVPEL